MATVAWVNHSLISTRTLVTQMGDVVFTGFKNPQQASAFWNTPNMARK